MAALVDEIVARGRRGAKSYSGEARTHDKNSLRAPALMWSWHGKRYLGGAHGVGGSLVTHRISIVSLKSLYDATAGILQMLVSAPDSMLERHWDAILQTVEWLINAQDPKTGNWAHKATRDMLSSSGTQTRPTRDEPDEMVQYALSRRHIPHYCLSTFTHLSFSLLDGVTALPACSSCSQRFYDSGRRGRSTCLSRSAAP